jgi:SAM-dependent methyltransferase
MSLPPTRWELGGSANDGYGQKFAELVATGQDVDGEARLADTLLPRGARVLDVGSGMGRVSAALLGRGHHVVAVEPDPRLVAQSRRTYPEVDVLELDVRSLTRDELSGRGRPTEFDLAVLVGNVMVFLAEGTERAVLEHVRGFLAPTGRVLVGFHVHGGPHTARPYGRVDFVGDVEASGLRVDLHAGSYELHPPGGDYGVWVLSRDDAPTITTSFGHPIGDGG